MSFGRVMLPRPCVLQGLRHDVTQPNPTVIGTLDVSTQFDINTATFAMLVWVPTVIVGTSLSGYLLRDGSGDGQIELMFGVLNNASALASYVICTRAKSGTNLSCTSTVDTISHLRGRFVWLTLKEFALGTAPEQRWCPVGGIPEEPSSYSNQIAGTTGFNAIDPPQYSYGQRDNGTAAMMWPCYAFAAWNRVLTDIEIMQLASRRMDVPIDPFIFILHKNKDINIDITGNQHTVRFNDIHLNSVSADFPAYRIPA